MQRHGKALVGAVGDERASERTGTETETFGKLAGYQLDQ